MRHAIQIDLIVFDMDGLILDTEPLYKVAWQSGCRELGYDLSDATYSTLVGRPTPDCERVLLDTLGADSPLGAFRERWPAIWQAWSRRMGSSSR